VRDRARAASKSDMTTEITTDAILRSLQFVNVDA
jgi:hypothetical protein